MLLFCPLWLCPFFFFNDTATTEIYTLSLHDALPISDQDPRQHRRTEFPDRAQRVVGRTILPVLLAREDARRSEEHTSELQSRLHLVCRLLLEKKKTCPRCRPAHEVGRARAELLLKMH